MTTIASDFRSVKPTVLLTDVKACIKNRLRHGEVFLSLLKSNSAAAFKEITGYSLPSGYDLQIIDDRIYLVVPEPSFLLQRDSAAVVEAPGWRLVVTPGRSCA